MKTKSDLKMNFLTKKSSREEDNSKALIIISNLTSFESLIPTGAEK
jgi:hypothetical protein